MASKKSKTQKAVTKTPRAAGGGSTSGLHIKVTKKRKPRQEKTATGPGYTERKVPARVCAKWKPLAPTSRKYVTTVLKSNISQVMHRASPRCYELVQDHLNELHARIRQSLDKANVPAKKLADYNRVDAYNKILEQTLEHHNQQLDRLKKRLDQSERAVEEYNEKKEQLQEEIKTLKQASAFSPAKKIHSQMDAMQKVHPTFKDLHTDGESGKSLHEKEKWRPPQREYLEHLEKTAIRVAEMLADDDS